MHRHTTTMSSILGNTVEKSFCTTREAAQLLGVSVGTVQLWVERGVLEAWKTTGGHRRVLRDSVDKLLRRAPAPAAPDPGAPSPSGQRRLQVMVVEDDESLLRLYRAKIAAWSLALDLLTFDNAFTALLSIGRSQPDLLITDLHMPGMDGFAMLDVLSKAPESARTAIVVVSGLDDDEIQARGGLPLGIEVLSKPIPFDRLHAIASRVARNKLLTPHPG